MKACIIFLFFCLSFEAFSRAPEDEILLPPMRYKNVRILRNKNVTFTNEQPDEKGASNIVRTEYSVKGRSFPDRTGRVVSQINSGSPVTPLKWSKDKKWVAVTVLGSGVRAWVPRSVLPPLDKNLRTSKKSLNADDEAQKETPKVKAKAQAGDDEN